MKRPVLKLLLSLVLLAGLCLACACASAATVISVGETVDLVCPYDLLTQKVVWVSSNAGIAHVQDTNTRHTTVTGITPGNARCVCYYYHNVFSVVGYRDGKWPIFGYTTGIESAVFDIKVELDPTGVSFATTGKTMRVGSATTTTTCSRSWATGTANGPYSAIPRA